VRLASYAFLTEADWTRRIDELDRIAARCELCPRRCGVNRLAGERGFCGAPGGLVLSSIFPHHGRSRRSPAPAARERSSSPTAP